MSGVLDEGAPRVPSEGRLDGVSVPELLWDLHRARHTGALFLEQEGLRKVLYLRDGRIVFAASTDPEDRLGPFLFRRGEIDLAPLLRASELVGTGRRLGEILVEEDLIDPADLVRAVLDQVREIALSVFPWSGGTWHLTRACLGPDETITLDAPMDELILAGVRRVCDGGRVRRALGGIRAVYRTAGPIPPETAARLGITERTILGELRRPCRVDRLCAEVFAPSEVVFRSLWALSILGLVQRTAVAPAAATGSALTEDREGWLEARGGAAALLLELGDASFTGALRLFREDVEAVVFLRGGLVEFARTSDMELSLAAHLLRRGVISDRDREQACRRLVSGKRIGTLLAELGALDVQDLHRFVREQVMEIVKRLALWTTGEYEIDEGETVDETIVLARSAEDVVLTAYESLEASERIWSELGGLDTVYRLLPEYLHRLDRVTLRAGLWDLVSLLGRERSLAEILAARPEPDFEICRSLCGLLRMNAVERVQPSPADAVIPTPWSAPARFGAEPELAEAVPAATAAELAPDLFPASAPDLFPGSVPDEEPPPIPPLPPPLPRTPDSAVRTQWPWDVSWPDVVPEAPDAVPEPDDEYPEQPFESFELADLPEPAVDDGPALDDTEEPTLEALPLPEESESRPYTAPVVIAAGWPEPECPATTPGPEPPAETGVAPIQWIQDGEAAEPGCPGAEAPWAALGIALPAAVPTPTADHPDLPELGALPEPELAPPPEAELAPTDEPTLTLAPDEQPALVPEPEAAHESDPSCRPEPAQSPAEPTEVAEGTGVEPTGAVEPSPRAILAVETFNARHRIVFDGLRREIGAGVRNYIATCARRLGTLGAPFDGLAPDKSGAFSARALARALDAQWPDAPERPLDALISEELDLVRNLLDPRRLAAIERALAELS